MDGRRRGKGVAICGFASTADGHRTKRFMMEYIPRRRVSKAKSRCHGCTIWLSSHRGNTRWMSRLKRRTEGRKVRPDLCRHPGPAQLFLNSSFLATRRRWLCASAISCSCARWGMADAKTKQESSIPCIDIHSICNSHSTNSGRQSQTSAAGSHAQPRPPF